MRSVRWSLLVVSIVCSVPIASVKAQTSDDERARAHFQAGQSYFAQEQYADAAAQFDEAYRLSHRPALLANASLAYERAGNLERAIERLESYLASGAPEVEAVRVSSTTRLEAMRQRHADELAAQEPENTEPPPDAPAVDVTPSPRPARLRIAGYAVGGAGVGLGAVSLVLFFRARSIHSDLAAVCGPTHDACPPDRAGDIDRGQRFSTVSLVTMAGSVASIAAGATLYVFGRRTHSDERATSAALDIAPGRVGLVAFGRF